jgi:ferric-dicitrate binding protein FerR (iron transport regulator)
LEDGSHVLLSANSRLEYPKEFSSQGNRTVNLTGEARFEVTKDAHRPFIVSADKMQTQVLGTVFDVNAYPGNAPAVTLYQGRVKVGKAASPLEKEIVPGQCATLTTSGDIRLTKATQTEKEGWTKDEFYYDNTEMITVLQNIGTWYNISVICHSADLLHKRVHFRFSRNVPIKTLLNVLNDLGIAHFQYKDKQIVVE